MRHNGGTVSGGPFGLAVGTKRPAGTSVAATIEMSGILRPINSAQGVPAATAGRGTNADRQKATTKPKAECTLQDPDRGRGAAICNLTSVIFNCTIAALGRIALNPPPRHKNLLVCDPGSVPDPVRCVVRSGFSRMRGIGSHAARK
jgi:hypothetical protein